MNKSLDAYRKALEKELASGKVFPEPEQKTTPEVETESDAAALEREDKAKETGKLINIHTAGTYGGK